MSSMPGPLRFPWDDALPRNESIHDELKRLISGPTGRPFPKPSLPRRVSDVVHFLLPCLKWLRSYNVRSSLLADIVAGISVGCMVVPQGMSYANLAGLPSVYGLYGAFVPCLVYPLLGSSRQLAVGPVAVTSLLIGTGLKEMLPEAATIQNPNHVDHELQKVQEQYNHMAIQLSFLVACMYTAIGIFRMGFLINFLSHSVIAGFTSGAAIIIGLSQVKYILGVSVPRQDAVHLQLQALFAALEDVRWREYAMGVSFLLLLLALRRISALRQGLTWVRAMGPLLVCVLGIALVALTGIEEDGEVATIRKIPAGLPAPTITWWFPLNKLGPLIKLGAIVMTVDLLESSSIAKAIARKNHYTLSYNQEIIALGVANFAGSIFHAYTTTGSFSRSAVNNESGAKTQVAQFVTGLVVMFVLLFLTPVFELMPYNCLAAVIIAGVSSLVDFSHPMHYYKVSKRDFLVWVAAFFGTMFAGVEIGLAIAIGLAVLLVIYESAFPHTAILGRIPGTAVYRNVKQYPDATTFPGMLLYRVDAPLYFANVNYVRDQLSHIIIHSPAPIHYVILEMSPISHIDATGLEALVEIIRDLRQQGMQLALANPSAMVARQLDLAEVPDVLGRQWIFVRMHDAVQFCQADRELRVANSGELELAELPSESVSEIVGLLS